MPKFGITRVQFYINVPYSGNSTTASVLSKSVRLNSCYDPDLTGIGVQPLGWD
jgi:hypothetical protein